MTDRDQIPEYYNLCEIHRYMGTSNLVANPACGCLLTIEISCTTSIGRQPGRARSRQKQL